MKIISLNTWSGVLLASLLDFFQNHKDTDVFCLQEIYKDAVGKESGEHPTLDMRLTIFEQIEEVLADTHTGYFHPCNKDFYGQATFVKKGITVDEEGAVFIFQNDAPSKRGLHSRNMQYIRVQHAGKPIIIANVHGLWNGMGKTDTEDRLEQSRRIRNFIKGRQEQIIVVGDFNLNPHTESIAIAGEGLRNLITEYGITSTRTSHYDKPGKFADYALVSPDIEVLDFKVLPDEVSDHAALELKIS
jgi:endonuclease/exonuclease/phosphatase family metal-dependent hydrolase